MRVSSTLWNELNEVWPFNSFSQSSREKKKTMMLPNATMGQSNALLILTTKIDAGVKGGKPTVVRSVTSLDPIVRRFGLAPEQLTRSLDIILSAKLGKQTDNLLLDLHPIGSFKDKVLTNPFFSTLVHLYDRRYDSKEVYQAAAASSVSPGNVRHPDPGSSRQEAQLCNPGRTSESKGTIENTLENNY